MPEFEATIKFKDLSKANQTEKQLSLIFQFVLEKYAVVEVLEFIDIKIIDEGSDKGKRNESKTTMGGYH